MDATERVRSMIADVERSFGAHGTKAGEFLDLYRGARAGLGFSMGTSQAGNREKYSLYRGWLYSAINAIASEAATQPLVVARLSGGTGTGKGHGPVLSKSHIGSLPGRIRTKAATTNLEILSNHQIHDMVENANAIQSKWQLLYMFVANLYLTGWAYVVGGWTDSGTWEMYALPTTWVHPDHTNGAFSRFKVVDPGNPVAADNDNDEWIPAENVGFAYIPHPGDPRLAYAPATSQMLAARIDDHIQSSQHVFFENGVFPSVIVSIGKDPHPDVPGGMRPRLSPAQRRQVMAAIRKTMAGVSNYGNPAIIDGLIESITKLQSNSTEMGWEKSEGTIRTRILSAFGVHPYILGEPVNVGGYAQAAKIEERFCKRVNTATDMFGSVITSFVPLMTNHTESDLQVWVEEAKARDPALEWANLNKARDRGDVSRNEIRARLDLPPDESGGDRNRTFTAGDVNAMVQICSMVTNGTITEEQAISLFMVSFDLSREDATILAQSPTLPPGQPVGPGGVPARNAVRGALRLLDSIERDDIGPDVDRGVHEILGAL